MRLGSIALAALLVLSACAAAAPSAEPSGSTSPAASTATPTTTATGTPSASTAAPSAAIDLSTLDACSLLDIATVRELTGTALDFETSDRPSTVNEASCFWGATVPGEPAYVETRVFKRDGLAGYTYEPGQGCTSTPVSVEAGAEAIGGTCSDPQPKVFLLLSDSGLAMSVLVNAPERPLEPADLLATARSKMDDILAG